MVQGLGLITLALAAASLSASAGGVWASIHFANRLGILDVPNERSSHTTPTPRMGGVPMVLAVVLTFGCWSLLAAGELFANKGLFHTILFAVAMAVLGFWDDLSGLSPSFRFVVQMVFAILVLWGSSSLALRFSDAGLADESRFFTQVGWILFGGVLAVWILNLYNFMDGIDGLAGGEAVVSSSFFFLVFSYYGESGWAVINLFIAAASMGFLVHNWPPARVFMGDAGSAFLGAFFGMQFVVASMATPVPFPVLVLPFSNFILDTTVTLLRRLFRGERWYHSHRSHYYQRMTNLGMTHRKVTVVELVASAGSCAAAAVYLNVGFLGRGILIVVLLSVFLSCGVWIGRREKQEACASPPL